MVAVCKWVSGSHTVIAICSARDIKQVTFGIQSQRKGNVQKVSIFIQVGSSSANGSCISTGLLLSSTQSIMEDAKEEMQNLMLDKVAVRIQPQKRRPRKRVNFHFQADPVL